MEATVKMAMRREKSKVGPKPRMNIPMPTTIATMLTCTTVMVVSPARNLPLNSASRYTGCEDARERPLRALGVDGVEPQGYADQRAEEAEEEQEGGDGAAAAGE